jgi:hypothetical protein
MVLVIAVSIQTGDANAQVLNAPEACNEFAMTDETLYDGVVFHTPMILLACQNGMFMDYGEGSGAHSGQPFLAANFDTSTSAVQGTVVDYEDGTGCGTNSYAVNGEIVDGQVLNLRGFRPVRIGANFANACMITGDVQRIDRQFVLAAQPAPPVVSSGTSSSGTTSSASSGQTSSGTSGGSCGLNAGTVVGGALGGLAGSQIGSGSGNKAAIAGGALLGALVGTRAGCN